MIITLNRSVVRAIVIAIVIMGGVGITIVANSGGKAAVPETSSSSLKTTINSATPVPLKQSGVMGDVTVDVQQKQLKSGEGNVVFAVAFNTHSVELDFDFTKIISLQDDLGNAYAADEWTGNSGWHHVNGDIIFPVLSPQATHVTLTISSIEDQTLQLSWDVPR